MTILDNEIRNIRLRARSDISATVAAQITPRGVSTQVIIRSDSTVRQMRVNGLSLSYCLDQIGRELREDMDARISLMLDHYAEWQPLCDEQGEIIGDTITLDESGPVTGKTLAEAMTKARLALKEGER